jgi:hypothetical protein
MKKNKYVKLSHYEEHKDLIVDAAAKDKIQAFFKHQPTGALVPVCPKIIQRMKNGETFTFDEAEKTTDRYYFKLPDIAKRWGMEQKECLGKLMELEVPCFFIPNDVHIELDTAKVCQDDVCVFKEYIDAVEKKKVKKKIDTKPEFIAVN